MMNPTQKIIVRVAGKMIDIGSKSAKGRKAIFAQMSPREITDAQDVVGAAFGEKIPTEVFEAEVENTDDHDWY